MKKLFTFFLVAFISASAFAQCPQTTCTDSLSYTTLKDTLLVSAGYTTPVWKVIAGPGILGTNSVSGLQPGATTVLLLSAQNGNMTTYSVKTITVAPVPVKPRSVVSFSFDSVNGMKYKYDDGSVQ